MLIFASLSRQHRAAAASFVPSAWQMTISIPSMLNTGSVHRKTPALGRGDVW